jgi:hypothetical protein
MHAGGRRWRLHVHVNGKAAGQPAKIGKIMEARGAPAETARA